MSSAGVVSTTTINPYQAFPSQQSKNERVKFTTDNPYIPEFVESRLKQSKNLDAKALYESRIKGKGVLLENRPREKRSKGQNEGDSEDGQEQRARGRAKRINKKRRLTCKDEAGIRGRWKLHEHQRRYELFVPLHQLWLGYMSELLGLSQLPATIPANPPMPNSAAMHAKLVKADFQGSIIAVKQAKNPCLIGLSGIVIHETENTFNIITLKNEVKLIPKQNSIFSFRVPLYDVRTIVGNPAQDPTQDREHGSRKSSNLDLIPRMEFELYGNQFRFRAADRASRKFKPKETIEL